MGRAKVISNRRKQKKQPDLLKDTLLLLESGLNLAVTFYMLLLMVIMPFYYTDGYANIGTDKHHFLYTSSGVAGVLFGILLLLYAAFWFAIWVREKRYAQWTGKTLWNSLSWTDRFAIGYGIVVLLSYLLSDFKETNNLGDAWNGATRWYMGALTQLLLIGIYFAISRCWKQNKWLPAIWLPLTAVLFVLGYLNRFEIRPLDMRNATKDFITTIGNINWYCAYIVIIFFGMLYYLWSQSEKKRWQWVISWIWLILGFGALVTQGSLSGVVTLFGMMLILYWFSMREYDSLQMFWGGAVCLGVACAIACSWRLLVPEYYSFEADIVDVLTHSPLSFVLPIVALFLVFMIGQLKKEKASLKMFCLLGYLGVSVTAIGIVGFVCLLVMNTLHPGSIGGLSDIAIFTFDENWGTLRGTNWRAGWKCFTGQDIMGKLLGVGPDCMVRYIYSGADVSLLELVNKTYPKMKLTNTHCEWLTVLVNTGILGLVTYVGMMVSAIVRFLKTRKQAPVIGACGFAILAYTINNMFSFQQSMGVATLFLVLGMGEAYLRAHQKGELV